MNKTAIIKYCSLIAKAASVVAGLAAYNGYIPEKFLPVAGLVFAFASVAKDAVNRIGDILDDGVENKSFGN